MLLMASQQRSPQRAAAVPPHNPHYYVELPLYDDLCRGSLTDAESATPGLRSIFVVIPQTRVMNVVQSVATGSYAFAGSASCEGQVTDSVWTYPDSVDGIGLGLASWFNLAESVLPRLA